MPKLNVNRKLWDQVCSTNPDYTKNANNGRFDFTAIDPYHQLEQATNLWGPYGDDWGIKNVSFQVLDCGGTPVMMMTGKFFYPSIHTSIDACSEFDYAVDEKFRPGWDVCKILQTSFRSKCLSLLGFNVDIYQGMFDDVSYVRGQEIKYGEYDKVYEEAMGRIKRCESMNHLDVIDDFVTLTKTRNQLTPDLAIALREAVDIKRQSLNAKDRKGE